MKRLVLVMLLSFLSFQAISKEVVTNHDHNVIEQPKYQITHYDSTLSGMLKRWAAIDNRKIIFRSHFDISLKNIDKNNDSFLNQKLKKAKTLYEAFKIASQITTRENDRLSYFYADKGEFAALVQDVDHLTCYNLQNSNRTEWNKYYTSNHYDKDFAFCKENDLFYKKS